MSQEQLFQMKKLLFHHVDEDCERTSTHYEGSVARPLQPLRGRDVHRCMCRDFIGDKQRKEYENNRCEWRDRDKFGFDKDIYTQEWYDSTHPPPTPNPTREPTTPKPTPMPRTRKPVYPPTRRPTPQPRVSPTRRPRTTPTRKPRDNPTPRPTPKPRDNPTPKPRDNDDGGGKDKDTKGGGDSGGGSEGSSCKAGGASCIKNYECCTTCKKFMVTGESVGECRS